MHFEHGSSLGATIASWETELNIPEEGATFEWDMVQEMNGTNEQGLHAEGLRSLVTSKRSSREQYQVTQLSIEFKSDIFEYGMEEGTGCRH